MFDMLFDSPMSQEELTIDFKAYVNQTKSNMQSAVDNDNTVICLVLGALIF